MGQRLCHKNSCLHYSSSLNQREMTDSNPDSVRLWIRPSIHVSIYSSEKLFGHQLRMSELFQNSRVAHVRRPGSQDYSYGHRTTVKDANSPTYFNLLWSLWSSSIGCSTFSTVCPCRLSGEVARWIQYRNPFVCVIPRRSQRSGVRSTVGILRGYW